MRKKAKNSPKIDMAEIAKRAKVSKMTVSRAVNNPKKVSQKTLLKIKKIIAKTNFSINQTAKFFRSGASNNVFCLIPTLKGGIFNDYISGMIKESEKFNSKIIIEIYDYSLKKEEEILLSCLSFKPKGIVLVGLEHTLKSKKLLNQFNNPIIETWDTSYSPIDRSVGFSHYRLGYDLADRMVKKYKNILFVKSNYSSVKGDYIRDQKKFVGFRNRILKEKRKIHVTTIFSLDHIESGKKIIKFIHNYKKAKIECVVCDEICALGAIHEANLLNIKLPKELSIIGIGNSQTLQLSLPKLTTIDVNAFKIGQKTISQIFQYDNNVVTDTGFKFVKGNSD